MVGWSLRSRTTDNDSIMPFYRRDLSIPRFWYPRAGPWTKPLRLLRDWLHFTKAQPRTRLPKEHFKSPSLCEWAGMEHILYLECWYHFQLPRALCCILHDLLQQLGRMVFRHSNKREKIVKINCPLAWNEITWETACFFYVFGALLLMDCIYWASMCQLILPRLYALAQLNCTIALWGQGYYIHFIDKETKPQLKSGKANMQVQLLGSKACILNYSVMLPPFRLSLHHSYF